MPVKPKEKKSEKKPVVKSSAAKPLPKGKKQANEEEDDDLDTETPKKGVKTASVKGSIAEDDSDEDVKEDGWNKEEEDEDWDPDFDEFDLPKSSAKKVAAGKKPVKEDDEFKIDDEFSDMFGGSSRGKYAEDEDDDY